MPSFWLEEKGMDVILHNKYGQYSRMELENQLKEGHLTVGELGDIYSLKPYGMVHVLRSLGIDYRNRLSDTRLPDFEITPSMHQIILGTLLGDAFMHVSRSYMVAHSINQMDYLYTIAENFNGAISTVSYVETELGKSLSLWTNRHEAFEIYFGRFYYRGCHKKYINQDTVPDLEPEGLAYWFMDDGKFGEYGLHLCTGIISDEEACILQQLLDTKFNIRTTLQTHDTVKDYRYIYIKAESRETFLSLIRPYIIPSMLYKVTGGSYPKLESENMIAYRHIDFCNKVKRMVRFSGNPFIEKLVGEGLHSSDKKGSYIKSIKDLMRDRKQISYTQFRKEPTLEDFKGLFEQGLTDQEIATRYGFGRNRISHIRRNLDIPRKSVRKKINKDMFPCLKVKLVSTEKIVSNEYNPNRVANPEMELLIRSISEDGVTQPIVVIHDEEKDRYVVIDGFHRYTVLRDHFKCEKIPVVVLEKSLSERMASTVRHNRARGKHQVNLMGILVNSLTNQGLTDEAISAHLGMEGEELLRLRQQIGCAPILASADYSRAWEIQ